MTFNDSLREHAVTRLRDTKRFWDVLNKINTFRNLVRALLIALVVGAITQTEALVYVAGIGFYVYMFQREWKASVAAEKTVADSDDAISESGAV